MWASSSAREPTAQVETERLLDRAAIVLARVPLAVGAVPPLDQAGVDERGEMTAHGRPGNTVRAHRELIIRWNDDEAAIFDKGFSIIRPRLVLLL